MEQGPITTPTLASFQRLSGKAVFFPTGSAAGIHMGSITMIKQALNEKTNDTKYAIDGDNITVKRQLTEVTPIWTIEGNQFHSAMKPLLLLGTKNSDVVQSSATAATLTITAALGRTFDIGARNITNVVVTVSAATKVDGTDFFLEAKDGLIRFPETAAGIANGASVLITFDKPALTRESYTAFNKLNNTGNLVLFEKDDVDPVAVNEWTFNGTLYTKSMGDTDVTKDKAWSMDFSVNGQPNMLSRKT